MDRAVLNKAIESRYDEIKGRVSGYCRVHHLTKQDAEDITQDIFVEILETEADLDVWDEIVYRVAGRYRTAKFREDVRKVRLT